MSACSENCSCGHGDSLKGIDIEKRVNDVLDGIESKIKPIKKQYTMDRAERYRQFYHYLPFPKYLKKRKGYKNNYELRKLEEKASVK